MSDVISTRIQKNPLQAYNSDTEDNNDPEDNKENANKRGKGKSYLFCTTYETGGSRNNIIRRLLAVCKNNKIKKKKFRLEFKNVLCM